LSSVQPCGTWRSPITAALVAAQGLRLSGVSLDADDIYWLEGRPDEGGRVAIVRWRDGERADATPPGFSARTRVHEYGGGAYAVRRGIAYAANFADQRVYRIAIDAGSPPEPLTPEGPWCYADLQVDERRGRLIGVREDHTAGAQDALTTLVAIPAATSGAPPHPTVLLSGYDFYSTPRLSPDGSRLSWLCWNHPQMPWDGTELWVADVTADGSLARPQHVAGGARESIYQPGWSPDGRLHFASDRDGWWQLYRADSTLAPVLDRPPDRSEFARPAWVFGTQTWASADADRLIVSYTQEGRWRLGTIDARARTLTPLAPDLEPHEWLAATATHAVLIASSAHAPATVVRIALADGRVETLRASSLVHLDPGYLSTPRAIEYPTTGGRTAHAFHYPPANRDVSAPAGERPPLIAISHGGPTTASSPALDLRVQFWTSRGFAVVDVNYGGSSGYGRPYRERLHGQWGIVDVEDVIAAARHLVARGEADEDRLIIRGGSAGGYTTLAALAFHPEVFRAGASYYGVSDLESLARDTHKFESRYLDALVGPYPSTREEYRRRSPIHVVDRLSCALILFQGLEDRVVPPNQSEMMADAVRRKGLPVAYLAFEGEQHGFRKAETIARCLEAELGFYGAVFGFAPADAIEPVPIDNL
jgi:dipeptidyl aminopeptidase/acylaminoacyl peptidase